MSGVTEWLYPIEGMHVHKGVLCMPDSTPDVLSWMEHELEFQDGDVLLCAYPSSGDRWLQELVWHMHHLDTVGKDKPTIGHRVPHIDHEFFQKKQPRDIMAAASGPRVVKSRMPAYLLERHLTGKVKTIFWTMDPRDTLLKYQHMYNTLGKFLKFPEITFDNFFKLFQEGQLFEGDWFDTTRSFLQYIGRQNFLFLEYEDVAGNIEGTVREISEFLGLSLSSDDIRKLMSVCPFDQKPVWGDNYTQDMFSWYTQKYKQQMAGTILENTYV